MLFAFRSEGQLVLPPSVKRESLLSRDVILLDFSSAAQFKPRTGVLSA